MSLLRTLAERLARPDIVIMGDRVVINRAPKGLVLNLGQSPGADFQDWEPPLTEAANV